MDLATFSDFHHSVLRYCAKNDTALNGRKKKVLCCVENLLQTNLCILLRASFTWSLSWKSIRAVCVCAVVAGRKTHKDRLIHYSLFTHQNIYAHKRTVAVDVARNQSRFFCSNLFLLFLFN